jgi:hypothetical protein
MAAAVPSLESPDPQRPFPQSLACIKHPLAVRMLKNLQKSSLVRSRDLQKFSLVLQDNAIEANNREGRLVATVRQSQKISRTTSPSTKFSKFQTFVSHRTHTCNDKNSRTHRRRYFLHLNHLAFVLGPLKAYPDQFSPSLDISAVLRRPKS